jgi:dTDP-4-dehydrorhamnose 3,5-epimerase
MKIFNFKKLEDSRGYFKKLLSKKFLDKNIKGKIVEVNLSFNKKKGTVRGFHYQIGVYKEEKIIFILYGKILDVSINLGKCKANKKVTTRILSANTDEGIIIPKNFAHGFQTLTENTLILYLHTKKFNPKYERTINPINNNLGFTWPLQVSNISKKDKDS